MADVPDIGKTPQNSPGPATNQPASGTYGEKAADQSLAAQLPQMQSAPSGPSGAPIAPDPNPITDMPSSGPGRPDMGGAAPPDGVPSAIFSGGPPTPTPMGPLTNPVSGAANAAQGRVIVLQQLSTSPDVSATTREWAKTMLKVLVG